MKRAMRRLFHLTERNKTDVIRLAHFFKRPANAHVTRQSLAAIGGPCKGGDGGTHLNAPADRMGSLSAFGRKRGAAHAAAGAVVHGQPAFAPSQTQPAGQVQATPARGSRFAPSWQPHAQLLPGHSR